LSLKLHYTVFLAHQMPSLRNQVYAKVEGNLKNPFVNLKLKNTNMI